MLITLDCSSRLYQVADSSTNVGWQTVSNTPMNVRRMTRPVKFGTAAMSVIHIPHRKILSDSHLAIGTRCRIQFSCNHQHPISLIAALYTHRKLDNQDSEVDNCRQPLILY